MYMYVVYDHPEDYPEGYAAKCWEIDGKRTTPTEIMITAPFLDAVETSVRLRGFGKRYPRSERDDKEIIEYFMEY